ncbi:hypothetical protein AOLI_G00274930 [Acnodon oligacanthus]
MKAEGSLEVGLPIRQPGGGPGTAKKGRTHLNHHWGKGGAARADGPQKRREKVTQMPRPRISTRHRNNPSAQDALFGPVS